MISCREGQRYAWQVASPEGCLEERSDFLDEKPASPVELCLAGASLRFTFVK
jgi:hypothetical protein